jgi:hypothetical protein
MVANYSFKTWAAEIITDEDMNRMEQGIRGRVYHVDPAGLYGDFTTVQAAIDQCEADGGGTVFLMAGTYTVAASWTIQGHNIALVGEKGAIVKKANGLDDSVLDIGEVATQRNHIVIRGISFDGNKANQTGGTEDLKIVSANDLVISNCYFYDAYLNAIGNGDYDSKNVWIEDNYFYNANQHCVYLYYSTNDIVNVHITDNEMNGQGYSGVVIDCRNTSCGYAFVNGNQIDMSASTSVAIAVIWTTNSPSNCVISGNGINNHTGVLSAIWAKWFDTVVKGNVINTCYNGISVVERFVVSGNEIYNADNLGINASTGNGVITGNHIEKVGAHGINLATSNEVLISGNSIVDCSQDASNTYSGINMNTCTYCSATGNHVTASGATVHKYAVDESGSKNHIVGNTSHGAGTNTINKTGAGSQDSANTGTV